MQVFVASESVGT